MPRPEPGSIVAALAPALGLLVLLGWTALSPAARAADQHPKRQLRQIEQQLDQNRAVQQQRSQEAAALQQEIARLKQRLVAAAHTAQEREQSASQAEARLNELHQQEFQLKARLQAQHGDLSSTLMALTRLESQPRVMLLAASDDPVRSLRTRRLLSLAARQLHARTQAVRQELQQLASLRQDLGEERRSYDTTRQRLRSSRDELHRLLAEKQDKLKRTEHESAAAAQRLITLTAKARDLRGLLQALSKNEPTAPGGAVPPVPPKRDQAERQTAMLGPLPRSFSAARGELPLPARGRVIRRFGEVSEKYGPHARGVTLLTRPEAQVVAPFDGEVVFAGPFRDYGVVLIIAHGEGYHTLLAGLSRLYVDTGQRVLAGEPVGQMGRGSGKDRSLYVELRRKGEAIDPLPWWADSGNKVSG